jgi:hypothetical protein
MSTPVATSILAGVDAELWAVLLLIAAATVSALLKALTGPSPARRRQPTLRRGATPSPFSYWYAMVPFEGDQGAKERPVLVLRLDGTTARVLKVTSKDKSGRTNYRRLDTSRWDRPGQRQGSWLQTDKVTTVPLAGFRRCLGDEHNAFFRQELVRRHPHEFGGPTDHDPQP